VLLSVQPCLDLDACRCPKQLQRNNSNRASFLEPASIKKR